MVGSNTFSNLNLTLQEIFENEEPFGKVSVLVVDDLMQLNPVGEKPVYKPTTRGHAALASSIWDLFTLYELTDIVRQKGDPRFAEILSRVRLGEQTQEDINQLKELERNDNINDGCLSIFLTNALKDVYNEKQLGLLSTEVYKIKAKDSKRDLHTKRIAVNVTSTNPHETGGLENEIQVALHAKYMQTKNVDTEDGLVNGATGTIIKLELPPSNPLEGTIFVKFDDPNTGKQAKSKSKYKGLVPIQPVAATFSISEKSSSILVERVQFPGTLAWGITVHKAQGSTFEEIVGDMTTPNDKNNTMPGQIYTMLSRAKSMTGLKLRYFHTDKTRINVSALNEMRRLQSTRQLVPIAFSIATQSILFECTIPEGTLWEFDTK
jgi:ATP-dependent DNA helicase PIF1